MTPTPLLGMIIQRNQSPTFRATPSQSLFMNDPYVHPLIPHIQFNPLHFPRRLNPQKITVKFGISHGSSPPWSHYTSPAYPLKTRMDRNYYYLDTLEILALLYARIIPFIIFILL